MRPCTGLLPQALRVRVQFLDWRPQEELRPVYDEHGVFLFPSFVEGFGKVFLEAMARGLCVVAADNGGAHDVITDGSDGILVPTGSANAMRDACLHLLRSPATAARLSEAAARRAQSYTWEAAAKATLRFYEDRLAAKKQRRAQPGSRSAL